MHINDLPVVTCLADRLKKLRLMQGGLTDPGRVCQIQVGCTAAELSRAKMQSLVEQEIQAAIERLKTLGVET